MELLLSIAHAEMCYLKLNRTGSEEVGELLKALTECDILSLSRCIGA